MQDGAHVKLGANVFYNCYCGWYIWLYRHYGGIGSDCQNIILYLYRFIHTDNHLTPVGYKRI